MGKKANRKPTVLLSKVPSLRDICDALGFRNSKEQNAFTDFSHKWRKTYRTSDNRSGTDLIQWKLQSTQDDLTRMANTFLHGVGTGEKFWPHLENPGDRLCFPDDEEKIIDLLKQLFWKQNKYAFNNAKYPKNNESRDPFRHSVGRQSSRDASENLAPSISIESSVNRPATDMVIVPKVKDRHKSEEESDEELSTREFTPDKPQSTSKYAATCETEVEDDVYTIQDDEPTTTPRATRRKNRLYDEAHLSPNKLASKPLSDTTSRSTSSKRPSQSTPGSSPKKAYAAILALPVGSPTAEPVPRVISGTVPSANVNEYIADDQSESPVPTSQSSNASSKSRAQVVLKKQHPTGPPTIMKTTELDKDQAQSKKDSLHPQKHQSPAAPSYLIPDLSPRLRRQSNYLRHNTHPHQQSTQSRPTAPPAKAPLPIPFHILQHTDGITRQTFWEAGRFGTKPLDEFLGDLAEKLRRLPAYFSMVKLVLRLGPLEIDADVEAGREDVWEIMKGTFKDEIRRAKVRGIGIGAVNVLVQPVMMEKGGSQCGGDGEEDEFEL
ncbi:hypothetical protein VE04_08595 [Pseudogymnoascus sp. 24MN13]|nr:hypothetical protein VE04_08595 [Pseudogymnoascus sp. 24MN13]